MKDSLGEQVQIAHMMKAGWRKIRSFRNISVHEYFGVDPSIIWRIVQQDIPVLEKALTEYSNQ
jgi:uncharacterized protein with HEPN domain